MAQLELPISNQVTNPIPVDFYYGPYTSVAEANAAVPIALRLVGDNFGRTVGIGVAGAQTEYWWNGGTADVNLVPKATGGAVEPPPADPMLRLLTGGDYIYDPDYEGVDSFHYILLAATWEASDGSDKSLPETPFAVAAAATGMFRLDVPCLTPTGSGALVIVSGVESDTVLTYPPIPDGYIALQSIFVNEEESYPYPYNIPTSNRDGSTGEIRKNSQTFASIDNLETLHGTTADEKFEIDIAVFQDTDTVSVEEGVDPDTGDRKIQFTASSGGGGGDYELPIASDSVLGGIKVGQGLEIDGDGVLSVLATSTNFIYMSPDGDDATGQRGNLGAPFATLAAAQAVYQANDVITVNPGVYTGQTSLEIAGQDVIYYFASGAIVTFTNYMAFVTGGDKVTIRGDGTFTATNSQVTGATIDWEFNTITCPTFRVETVCTMRLKGQAMTTSTLVYINDRIGGSVEVRNWTTGPSYLGTITVMEFSNTTINQSGTPFWFFNGLSEASTYSDLRFTNCVINSDNFSSGTGTGTTNVFYGTLTLKNTTINSAQHGLRVQKFYPTSRLIFDAAVINAGSGYKSLEALTFYLIAGGDGTGDALYQPRYIPIKILSGGLTISRDMDNHFTNLIPGSYAYRVDYSGSTPVTSRFSELLTIDEPGTGSGGGSALTVKDEGSSLSTAVTSIDFVGAGVTTSNTGGAVTVDIPGPSVTVDSVPTDGSSNPVSSNGVFDALALKATPADIQSGTSTYATVSGTDTYTSTLSPVPGSYTTGMTVRLNFANANTGAATINLNSLGAKALKKQGGAALAAGDIAASTIYTAVYDGTSFQLDIGIIGQWYDWVPTWTGFSVNPTTTVARYCVIGKLCTIYLRAVGGGTSNATTTTVTLPFATPNTASNQMVFAIQAVNAGVVVGATGTTTAVIQTRSNSNIADLFTSFASAAWTASGTKGVSISSFSYEIP